MKSTVILDVQWLVGWSLTSALMHSILDIITYDILCSIISVVNHAVNTVGLYTVSALNCILSRSRLPLRWLVHLVGRR